MYDETANFLMMIVDEEKELIDNCKIIPSEALRLTMPLHALIDDELSDKSLYISPDQERKCAEFCHCGVYSDLAKEKTLKDRLYKKASSMPRKSLVACANQTAKWLCSSNILKKLRSEIINN